MELNGVHDTNPHRKWEEWLPLQVIHHVEDEENNQPQQVITC